MFKLSPLAPLIALLLLGICRSSSAHLPEADFRHLGVEDGLPSIRTTVVSQGPKRRIWIGTESGLVVYDGYQLTAIAAADHPVSTNPISDIEHDDSGSTWIATERSGLFRYDPVTAHIESIALSQSPIEIKDLDSSDGWLWIAITQTVFKLAIATGDISRIELPERVTWVYALLALDDSAAVATNQGVIYTNDPQQQHRFQTGKPPMVNALHLSPDGTMWAATHSGLFHLDEQGDAFIEFSPAAGTPSPFRDEYIKTITQDPQGRYWVGGDRTGVCRITARAEVDCYRYRSDDASSLSTEAVRSVHVDRENNLWLATGAGIDRVSLLEFEFGRYTDAAHGPLNCLRAPGINAILAEEDAVWLGSNKGLVRWGNDCSHFGSEKDNPTTLSAPEVYALWREDTDRLWVATSAGLDLLDESTGEVTRNAADSFGQIPIWGFAESENGDLLVSAGQRVFRRSAGSETFHRIDVLDEQLRAFTWHIEPTPSGQFWVGTDHGLGILRSIEEPLELIRKPNGEALFSQAIGALHAEPDGNVWVGVDTLGLFLMSPEGEVLERHDESSGLANIEFSAILPDDGNNLWISTRRGIVRMNKATGHITAFGKADGLQDAFFMQNAAATGPDGRLYFGGGNGINVFRPERIVPPVSVKPQLSALFVDGQRAQPQAESDDAVLLEPLAQTDSLEFSHRNEAFSLEFLSVSHTAPQRIRYGYWLEGAHTNWNLVDAQNRRATYTSLRPGSYTFRFKAAAPHGDWVEGDPLQIRILPPPWLTPWAFAIYALILATAVVAVFLLRTRALRKRTVALEKRVAERTSTIEALLDKKNEELANLSHEFRTPLTLILGPIRNLLSRTEADDTRQKLQVAQRNAQRLLRMVDQLLQMERFKVQQALKPRAQRVKPIVEHITRSFEELGAEKHIQVTTGQIDDVWLAFAPDAFEKILLNLLSNALKYTDAGGQVSLSLIADSKNATLTVTDTGIGIAEEKQNQIFERFQRALDEHSETIVGTGIGLALVKELVEAHGGQIELHSAPGEGSRFMVTVPLADPAADEMDESPLNTDLLELELATLGQAEGASENVAQDPLGESGGDTRILVIEDNADMRAYIMESLAEAGGYQISSAKNGQEGVEAARLEVPDIIISDIMMPVMDGFQVVRELKADDRTSHIPIILLTARGDRKSRLRGWNEKADEYLTKPFDEEELRLRVKNLLDVRSLLRKRFGHTHFPGHQPSAKTDDDALNPRDQAFLEKFQTMIEEHHGDPDFKVVDMASHMAMSERPLQRKLKALLGHTPNEYLRAYRLEKAAERLRQGETVAEVAFAVGFSSQSYFSTCFKAHFGVVPSMFLSTGFVKH